MKKIVFNIFCNDYTDPLVTTFSNPKGPSMLGIMLLYDKIMFFITLVFILKVIFYVEAIYISYREEIDRFITPFVVAYKFSDKFRDESFPGYGVAIYGYYTLYYRECYLVDATLRVYPKYYLDFCYYVGFRLNDFRHCATVEFLWTLLPAWILILMALPSLFLLYSLESSDTPLFTVLITGNQWYWTYEYSDFDVHSVFTEISINNIAKNLKEKGLFIDSAELRSVVFDDAFTFAKKKFAKFIVLDSSPVSDDDLPKGSPRMLTTDQPLILPANCEIRLLITSNDVIHSWAVPAFGIKMDAIPGRINQLVFKTPFPGTSWGQCSEICGVNHSYMPIEVRVIKLRDFERFIDFYIARNFKDSLTTYAAEMSNKILSNTSQKTNGGLN